ncbi:Hint domain-containing protein [Desulfosporosinus youngiae]|uniref:Hint domain-containing protein n=1 Tax=Desulfosporosinus youngiae DSM 17734 TaxID=768710 RepID=H5XVF2_9FIRM|nr:Hint domain-containing protein [Desulfosporosinus youngiae]EHQ89888.1 hypothetical protein DesyoDRAFT_2840 [Desulfosporosinus youngiae DSM 17734]
MYPSLSDLKNKVLKEIDPRIGYLELDFSNENHYKFFTEQVGGLKKFEEENPELIGVLKKLRKEKKVKTELFRNDGYHDGPDNQMAIENLLVRERHSVSNDVNDGNDPAGTGLAEIRADYINTKKRIKVVTEFRDVTLNMLLSTLEEYVDNTNLYNGIITADYSKLVQDKPRQFLIISTFYCSEEHQSGGSTELKLNAYVTKQDSFMVKSNKDMIKSFTVNAPVIQEKHKKDPNHDKVQVSYLRDGVIPNYDYSYPYDPFIDDKHEKILVRMPFSVTVEANDGFWIDGMAEEYGYDLWLTNVVNGQIRAFANYSEIIQRKDAFNSQNQCTKMTFIFPDSWRNIIDNSKLGYQPNTNVDFYGSFKVLITDEFSSLPIGVSVKSYGDLYDRLNLQCPKIWIQWGCVAKETLITLADGTFKEAQYVTMENLIMTRNGTGAKLTNIYKGPQGKIQEIITDSGKSIKMTKDHIIYSENGLLPAFQLLVGMKIRTVDGLESVIQNNEVDYNDTVYNFQFANNQVIIGNGMYIGDYILQNSIKEITQYED